MASVIGVVLFVFVLVLHTFLSAVMTRFFRIRLETTGGWLFFTAFFIPVVLFISTLVFTGVLGIGINLGSSTVALGVMIGLPLAIGFTIDVLYIPAPENVDLPEPR